MRDADCIRRHRCEGAARFTADIHRGQNEIIPMSVFNPIKDIRSVNRIKCIPFCLATDMAGSVTNIFVEMVGNFLNFIRVEVHA